MRADVSGGSSHQVAVLEDFAEFAGRLHGTKQSQLRFRRRILEFEQPFHVLPRQAGAGADQVLDQNFLRGFGVAQFECGIDVNDRLVPLQLLLVDEFGKQQRRHTLRVRRSHKQNVLVDAFGLAEFAHSESTLVYNLAAIDERHRNAGDAEFLHRCFHK